MNVLFNKFWSIEEPYYVSHCLGNFHQLDYDEWTPNVIYGSRRPFRQINVPEFPTNNTGFNFRNGMLGITLLIGQNGSYGYADGDTRDFGISYSVLPASSHSLTYK